MAEYVPIRKPGKLTLQEAEEKFMDQHILQRDMVQATGMTTSELDDEAMRSGGWSEEAIKEFNDFFGG